MRLFLWADSEGMLLKYVHVQRIMDVRKSWLFPVFYLLSAFVLSLLGLKNSVRPSPAAARPISLWLTAKPNNSASRQMSLHACFLINPTISPSISSVFFPLPLYCSIQTPGTAPRVLETLALISSPLAAFFFPALSPSSHLPLCILSIPHFSLRSRTTSSGPLYLLDTIANFHIGSDKKRIRHAL